jgi:V/A-type H+/Na+-transporting ATPase subunit D
MAELRHVPPGRAGRLWLDQRLHSGRRAADLLDRKLKVLRAELERFEEKRDQADQRWREAWRQADTWGLRATMADGLRELRLAEPSTMARVSVAWDSVMGLRYPAEAQVEPPAVAPSDRGPGGAALVEASTAYREALRAAASLGAASAACRVIEAEIGQTRRRLRAITERWIPRLESRLSRLRQELDETEREENFRRRRAASRNSP